MEYLAKAWRGLYGIFAPPDPIFHKNEGKITTFSCQIFSIQEHHLPADEAAEYMKMYW